MAQIRGGAAAYYTRTFATDALAWAAFLLLAAASVIGWHRWTHREVLQASDAVAGVADARVAILAYDRVVETPDARHMDRERIRQHLEALRHDGFQPVTLEALARFYRGQGTLPAKSVLLTFDHGYLSTVTAVDPVLRELKWPAVMFVMTERQQRRDPFFLYWPLLTQMVDSGIWQVGSHGHQGHNPVSLDAAGAEGPFFIRRAWLADRGREETWEEFTTRLQEDHQRARSVLQRRVARPILAYAPPLKDVAVASLDPELHRAYEQTLRDFYAVAFVDDLFGVNDRSADPYHLKRLRVDPQWSAEDLAERVAHGLGSQATQPEGDELAQRLWVSATGPAMLRDGVLVAGGRARADLWRAGSSWSEDWMLEADVEIESGQLWIVQQSGDLSEEWRWGGDERRTHLQRRRPAQTVETLASFPARIVPGRRHHLKLVRRGTGVWVEWDGKPVAERPSYLPDRWRGNVGLVTWGGGRRTHLQLSRVRFSAFPYRTRPLGSRPTSRDVQAAVQDAWSLSALSPRWLEAVGDGLREESLDRNLLAILSHRYGWEIVPVLHVRPGAEGAVASWLPEALARAKREGFRGLRLDVTRVPAAAREQLVAYADRQSHAEGLRLVLDPEPRVGASLRADAAQALPAAGGALP
jgi:peptidoglycan/xylan/chitin deacetylase (PgdA/CDA1 family)